MGGHVLREDILLEDMSTGEYVLLKNVPYRRMCLIGHVLWENILCEDMS